MVGCTYFFFEKVFFWYTLLSSVTIKCQINKDCHKSKFSIVSIVISVSNVTSHYACPFRVFSNVFVFVNFFGHVFSSMSQRSQVSKIAIRRCSQNVFVFVFVIVFVNFFGQMLYLIKRDLDNWSSLSFMSSLQTYYFPGQKLLRGDLVRLQKCAMIHNTFSLFTLNQSSSRVVFPIKIHKRSSHS